MPKCPTCHQELPRVTTWTVHTSAITTDEEPVLYWCDEHGDTGAPVGQEGSLIAARAELAKAVALLREKGEAEARNLLDYAAVECAAFEILAENPDRADMDRVGRVFGGIRWSTPLKPLLRVLKVRASAIASAAIVAEPPPPESP